MTSRALGAAVGSALVAVGVAVHGWFAAGADALDSDRALVLLMARAFARGEWSLYFWEQNYMAALEPLLLTPLAVGGMATPIAASLLAIVLSVLLAALSIWLCRRAGGGDAWWMTLLMWAVPPAVVVHHHVSLYGARLAASVLAVGAFAVALGARSTRAWVAAGVLTGAAYFADHLMLTWAAATIYLAARSGATRSFVLGALPMVVVDTVAAMATPAFHLSGPNDPAAWLANVPLLFGTVIPQLFGILLGRAPGPLFEAVTPLIAPGLAGVAAIVIGIGIVGALVGTLVRARPHSDALHAMLIACVVAVGLFVFTGGGGDRWPARYLVPLWPAITVFAALAVSRWRPTLRPLGALIVVPAAITLVADRSWPRGDDGAHARAEAASVATAVRDADVGAVWTNYWDTYRMTLLAGEPPPWVTIRIIERRPELARRARESSPVGYLLRNGDTEVLDRLRAADSARTVRTLGARDVGRYRLIVVDRTLPELVVMNPPPSRGWQMLAAASSGALFLLVLATITSGSRLVPGRGGSTATRS